MGRSRRNKPLLERVVISDIAAEGKALGKVNDTVVFVPLAAPGDVVDVQVTKKEKDITKEDRYDSIIFPISAQNLFAVTSEHVADANGNTFPITNS
ncbi:TRAM domain-containing protein [Anaerophaga thermohalophila]|uniref:TRAM domain-containing protein n=1 Tax=Anaerophaga thermohalophila TaxID=177400 RepID=UPI0002F6989A|nr:TRAM domain-containing protein [Anaerophaga thermohalophila]